jgi:hypothetical protein
MPWYKKVLLPYLRNQQEMNAIQNGFNKPWSEAGLPEDMALFHVYTPHEEAIYFSPATENYAISCGAVPCEKPLDGSFEYRIGVLSGNGDPFDFFQIVKYEGH